MFLIINIYGYALYIPCIFHIRRTLNNGVLGFVRAATSSDDYKIRRLQDSGATRLRTTDFRFAGARTSAEGYKIQKATRFRGLQDYAPQIFGPPPIQS